MELIHKYPLCVSKPYPYDSSGYEMAQHKWRKWTSTTIQIYIFCTEKSRMWLMKNLFRVTLLLILTILHSKRYSFGYRRISQVTFLTHHFLGEWELIFIIISRVYTDDNWLEYKFGRSEGPELVKKKML